MRGMFRPIPKSCLASTMTVRTPLPDGAFSEPVAVIGVGLEKKRIVSADPHRAEVAEARVFVDAVNSQGAFEVPAGSRVVVDGRPYVVTECATFCDLFGRVHHYELKLG